MQVLRYWQRMQCNSHSAEPVEGSVGVKIKQCVAEEEGYSLPCEIHGVFKLMNLQGWVINLFYSPHQSFLFLSGKEITK